MAIILATGDIDSSALRVLWLAPIGWAIVLDRRTAYAIRNTPISDSRETNPTRSRSRVPAVR